MDTAIITAADHWDGPPAFWPLIPLLWVVVTGLIVWFAMRSARRNCSLAGPRTGEARLAERFAAGEIDDQEYAARLEVLRR